jgi:excisionase family DNA binding protein
LAHAALDVHALEADPTLVDALALEELPLVLERCAVEHERLAVVEHVAHARLRRELATARPSTTEGLLTATDAARVLGVPKSYILELGRRGDIPRVTMGKYVRFRPADLATYIAAHLDR